MIALYLIVTLTAAVKNEEAFLRRTFGDRYDRYRHGGSGVAADSQRRFSFAQAQPDGGSRPRSINAKD